MQRPRRHGRDDARRDERAVGQREAAARRLAAQAFARGRLEAEGLVEDVVEVGEGCEGCAAQLGRGGVIGGGGVEIGAQPLARRRVAREVEERVADGGGGRVAAG